MPRNGIGICKAGLLFCSFNCIAFNSKFRLNGCAETYLIRLFCRLGQVENARRHMYIPGSQPDSNEHHKLQAVEKHLSRCADARRVGEWKTVLRESDAAIAAGADFSCQVIRF